MIQTLPKPISFAEFIACIPDNLGKRYELRDGIIIEMSQPLGGHEEIIGFLVTKLVVEYERLKLPYFIPKQALVKALSRESGYLPDILLLNRPSLASEPLWKKASTVTTAASIPLVVEVVSTNWRDDYFIKFADYEEIGIPEYWIVDYLGLGGKRFIGNPKQPTISVHSLVDGEYQVSHFRSNERIQSLIFPELSLTAGQIFEVGEREQGGF